MRIKHLFLVAAVGLLGSLSTAVAQLNIPSDGSDGVFAPTEDTVIDLSQAVTGKWDDNNSANAGKGIYDPDKWAIVFKYSSVNIPGAHDDQGNLTGVRVTFKNHPSRAPVVWLVQGDSVVEGLVDLTGQGGRSGPEALYLTEPGPGGFRGGPFGPEGEGDGLGPGGGNGSGNVTGAYRSAYGNPQVVPLVGGSGGGGDFRNGSGAAGAGALLIATAGTTQLNGRLSARTATAGYWASASSGGAIRIVSQQLAGGGEVNCLEDGRIRIETFAMSPTLKTFPETVSVPPANPPVIWPPDNAPRVKIVSVDTVAAPADPTAPLTTSADIGIQNDQQVDVILETRDFPIEGDVSVRVAQKWGTAEWKKASYVSGTQAQATWKLTTPFVKGYTTLQARATAP